MWTGCALLLGMASATHAGEPAASATPVYATPIQTAQSPLDRLRARSAEQRLQELRQSWRESERELQRVTEEFARPATPAQASTAEASNTPGNSSPVSESPIQTVSDIRSDANVGPIPAYSGEFSVEEYPAAETGVGEEPATSFFARLVQAAEAEGSLYIPPVRDPQELKKLNEINPFYDAPPAGRMPEDVLELDERSMKEVPQYVALSSGPYVQREPAHENKPWLASDLYHKPLYFQDENLERHGHTLDWEFLQPAASVGKFGAQFLILPYQMTLNQVNKPMYVLGHYRPGDFVPYKSNKLPWNTKALFNQSAVTTGLFFLIP